MSRRKLPRRPRKRAIRKFKANPDFMHDYEAGIILRDLLELSHSASSNPSFTMFSPAQLLFRYPGRYHKPNLLKALKRMQRQGLLVKSPFRVTSMGTRSTLYGVPWLNPRRKGVAA